MYLLSPLRFRRIDHDVLVVVLVGLAAAASAAAVTVSDTKPALAPEFRGGPTAVGTYAETVTYGTWPDMTS
jgi:hypothetical protein